MRHALRGRGSIVLLRLTLRITTSIRHGRRIHVWPSVHGLESLRGTILHGSIATIVAARSEATPTAAAASWTIVRSLINANDSAVKPRQC